MWRHFGFGIALRFSRSASEALIVGNSKYRLATLKAFELKLADFDDRRFEFGNKFARHQQGSPAGTAEAFEPAHDVDVATDRSEVEAFS